MHRRINRCRLEEKERRDLYLLAKNAEFLNQKLRGGKARLELKHKKAEMDINACDGQISGVLENWSRWERRYSKPSGEAVISAFDQDGLKGKRVEVDKSRLQRKFQIMADGSARPDSVDKRFDSACIVEITHLEVQGKKWWTIAFDVVNDSEVALAVSQQIVCEILENYPGPRLLAESSYAYPHGWQLS